MIITRIKLNPFAGIANAELTFTDGLNVIVGPNEAGKSTIFRAIQKVLFTKTQLHRRDFEKEISPCIPIDGDTASAEIQFSHNGEQYTFRKSWGARESVELILPTGSTLNDDDAIEQKLNEILPASEAAFKSILMTYQSGLQQTLQELKDEYPETLQNLGDLLRAALLNTDGVSVDKFKEQVNQLYDDQFRRWDSQRNQPEGGRGIENPWKKNFGSIVKAYYLKEKTRTEHKNAEMLEEKYDKLNKEIRDFDEAIGRMSEYINKNSSAVNDAHERRTLQAELNSLKKDIDELKNVNENWPVVESKSKEIKSQLPALEEKFKELKEEKERAELMEANKPLIENVERGKRLQTELEKAQAELNKTKKLDREDLKKIRDANQFYEKLLNSIRAGKLKAKFTAKRENQLKVQLDFKPKESFSISEAEAKEFEAGGRIKLEHSDWILELTSGEGDFEKLEKELQASAQNLKKILEQFDIRTVNEAVAINEEYEQELNAVKNAEKNLKSELGSDTLENLEKKIEFIKNLKPARDLATVAVEFNDTKRDIDSKKNELIKSEEFVGAYEKKYKTKDELLTKLAKAFGKENEINEKIEQLLPLPEGVSDFDAFIREFEETKGKLEEVREKKNNLAIEKARIEENLPEQSVEELYKDFILADEVFCSQLRRGKAIARLKEVTEKSVELLDIGTYEGLENDIGKYVAVMTGDRYSDIEMDGSLPKGFVRKDGKILPVEFLSGGTMDVLGLAIRLAIAKYFLGSSDGFLVMDDPLVDLDPQRQKKAAEIIFNFAMNKQTIIFTCNPEHAELLGGNILQLD
ncbi:MAG: SMC family ATPase [Bacteroidota bacterium]|nr:SMC family ATPase [Bacteroidota bacterium]